MELIQMGLSRDLTARQLAGFVDGGVEQVRAGLVDGGVEQVRVRVLPDGRMTRKHAARYLGCKPKTLAMWALSGKGPASIKVGGRVFYYRDDLDAFIRSGDAD